MSEAESVMVLRRVPAVSSEALAEVLDRHRALICRLARQTVGADADLEDVIQDALVAIATSLSRFRGECKLSTWVASVTVRTALRHASRRRRSEARTTPLDAGGEVEALAGSQGDEPGRTLEAKEFRACLQSAIDRLPPDQRAVVALRHVEGLALQEIAKALGTPIGTVKSRLHHARRSLREMMTPYLEESGGEA
jgi:RNA polymerase sigma-70 factor (ECF subfamily)